MFDIEFKRQVQFMLERFLEDQLAVADGKIIGIPFVCQNITNFFMKIQESHVNRTEFRDVRLGFEIYEEL